MSSVKFICLFVVAAALEPAAAYAQTEPAPPAPAGQASADQGPETPFKLSATALYDSNVAKGSRALAAARGLVREDFKYSPTLTVDYSRIFGHESIYLNGIAGYDFYQRNSVLNREHVNLEGGLNTTLKSCVVTLKGDISRRQSSLEDLVGTVTSNTITQTAVGVDGRCDRDQGFAPFFSAQRSWSVNSAHALINNDTHAWVVDGGVSYIAPGLGKFSAFVDYDNAVFPKRVFIFGGTPHEDSFTIWNTGLRFERDLGERLGLTLSVSHASLDPSTPFERKFQGFAYQASLQYQLSGRLQLQALFEHKPTPSYQLNASYSIDTLYRASANYQLSGRTTLGLNFQHKRERLRGGFIVPGVDLSSETLSSVGGTIDYQLSSRLSLQLFADDERRRADVGLFNYDSTQVGVTLSAAL